MYIPGTRPRGPMQAQSPANDVDTPDTASHSDPDLWGISRIAGGLCRCRIDPMGSGVSLVPLDARSDLSGPRSTSAHDRSVT